MRDFMSTEIYYFSGTGNSLAVAKDITEKLRGELIPIVSVVGEESIKTDADVIGLVFPTYYEPYGGVPLIVRRFIHKLENMKSKYIFAICTYGSGSFNTLKFIGKLVESHGGKLSAGFTVNMPNNMAGSKINNTSKQQKMSRVWKENIEVISENIIARKECRLDTPNVLAGKAYILIKLMVRPLIFLFKPLTLMHLKKYSNSPNQSYEGLLPFMDRSFHADEKCIGCRTCLRICPVENIQMVHKMPEWQHRCEFCLACFHWCPKGAITSSELRNTVRYHHHDVKILDMVVRD